MNEVKATRYWGTLALLVIGYLLGVAIANLPEIITALKQ